MAQSLHSDSERDNVDGQPARHETLPRGTVLDDTYRIEEPLGAGAGGTVTA